MSLEEFSKIKANTGKFRSQRVKFSVGGSSTNNKKNGNSGEYGSKANATEAVFKVVSHIKKGSMAVLPYIARDHHDENERELNDGLSSAVRVNNYITRDGKILMQHSSGAEMDADDMKKLMVDWNEQFKKDDRKNARTMTHIILSTDQCKNAEEFKRIVSESLSKSMPDNFEYVFAVHTDTNNLHAHLVINNYGLDGKKLHIDKNWCNEQRLQFSETLNEFGYAHKATLKHHRDLDKKLKQEIAESETYVTNYFSAIAKNSHPENYKNLVHLKKVYEETNSISDLKQLRKEIELSRMSETQSKIKLNRAVNQVRQLGLKSKVERNVEKTFKKSVETNITRLEKKQVAAVTDMLLLEKKLLDGGQLSDKRISTIRDIKASLPTKVLEQAQDNLRRRQDPVFSKLDRECQKYLKGIATNGIETSTHDERLFKVVELGNKIRNNEDNLSKGHQAILSERYNKIVTEYEKAGIKVSAAAEMLDKQKKLNTDIRLIRYSDAQDLATRIQEMRQRIPKVAITEKDRFRLELNLRKEILLKNNDVSSAVLDAEKSLYQANKAIDTSTQRGPKNTFALVENAIRLNRAFETLEKAQTVTTKLNKVLTDGFAKLDTAGISREAIKAHVKQVESVENLTHRPAELKSFRDLAKDSERLLLSPKHRVECQKKLRDALSRQYPEESEKVGQVEKTLYALAKANRTLQSDPEKTPLIQANAVKLMLAMQEAKKLSFPLPRAIQAAQDAVDLSLSKGFRRENLDNLAKFSQLVKSESTTPHPDLQKLWVNVDKMQTQGERRFANKEIKNMIKQSMPDMYKQLLACEKSINQAEAANRTLSQKDGNQTQWITQNALKILENADTLKTLGQEKSDIYRKAVQSIESLNKHGIDSTQLKAIHQFNNRIKELIKDANPQLADGQVHRISTKIAALEKELKAAGVRLPKETYKSLKELSKNIENTSASLQRQSKELAAKIKPIEPGMTNLEKVKIRKANQPYIVQQQKIEQKLTGKAPKKEHQIKR